MLLDAQNLFSDNQSITTGSAYSTNVVKFGKNDVSYVPVVIQVTENFAGLTSLKIEFETADNVSFTNAVSLIDSTLLLADLKAGKKFPVSYLPRGNKGYMRIKYTVVGTATAGKITAGVVASDELSWHEQ